jgi:hypothetical protein
MKLRFAICLFITVFALIGCAKANDDSATNSASSAQVLLDLAVSPQSQDILDNPDKVTLYTIAGYLDSKTLKEGEYHALPDFDPLVAELNGTKVLGSAALSRPDGMALVATLVQAIRQGSEDGVMCFYPHHAIRVEKGDRRLDILICFKCRNYQVVPDGGYNNVVMNTKSGMEDTWRAVVRKHGLRDISDNEK